jgi:serine/threonine protein kinase
MEGMEIFKEIKPFGPYRLLSKVGEGGMAEVFMAMTTQQEFQGQFLAIKKLHQRLNENKAFVNLLIHEAKVGVLLNHPGIVAVHDLGSYQAEFFIAMEYVHGKSLDLALHKIAEGRAAPFDQELASFIVLETLRALAFAHSLKDVKGRELHIVHRDVSPGNILMEYKGNVKLSDFGIATAESRLQPEFTQHAMGKLVYMAPEQAINDPVVQASDIYSLGVIYYQLLTGQLPFQSDNAQTLYRRIVEGKINDPRLLAPHLDEALIEILMKALDRSPRKRFRTAIECFDRIHSYFLSEHHIDFTSRTVRAYYRKKLAEYLRKTFEQDISLELELIQNSLKTPPEEEDFKATVPIQIPAHLTQDANPVEDERTIFEADHTNEATRHYPLTESERRAIIEGLPPHQVLQEREEFGRTSGFEMATIPDYDLNIFDGRTQNRKVSDKLENTSLGRDELETLKQQMPAMEITNEEDLEAFERSTFSGNRPGIDFTDESKQTDLKITMEELETPEELESKERSRVKETKDLGVVTQKPTPVKTITEKVKIPSFATEKCRRLLVGFGLVLASLGILFFGTKSVMTYWNQQPKLLPTQQLSLIFLGELSLSEQRTFFQSLNDSNQRYHLQQVSDLFSREYKFYTGREELPIQILAHEPELLSRALSAQANAHELFHSPKIFEFFGDLGFSPKEDSDSNIYTYLLPESRGPSRLPQEIPGPYHHRQGFVFTTVSDESVFEFLIHLAREVAHLHGATDKENPVSGGARIPEGLGQPERNPRFPQKYADLMGYHLMVSPFEAEIPLEWGEIVINPYTAAEMGWIKPSQIPEFLQRIREH